MILIKSRSRKFRSGQRLDARAGDRDSVDPGRHAPPSAVTIAEATLSSGTPTRFMNASDVIPLIAPYASAARAPMVVPSMGRGNTARKRMPSFARAREEAG